jgi:hypothetical protein
MRADLARRCNLRVLHSGADMSKPDQVMLGLTKAVALEVAETRITCNAL